MLEKLFSSKKHPEPNDAEVAQVNAALDRYDRIFRGSRGYGFLDFDVLRGKAHWRGGFWSHLGYDDTEIYKGKEIEGISDAEHFLNYVHVDDRETFTNKLTSLIKTQECEDLIFRVVKKDGSYLWVELRLDAVCNDDGRVSHLSGVVFDVSALKETEQALKISEARHARIIEASNDGIWEWSAEYGGKYMEHTNDGGWTWSNQEGSFTFSSRCWEMIGYSMDDDVVREGIVAWRRLMHKDDGKRFDKVLSDHIFKRVPFDIEYRIRGKDGEWHWILGRGQMSHDKHGRPKILSGTNMDITALKRAEERVMRAKEEAEKANHAKSEFLSSMSHELRTPLNAILGFAQLFDLDTNLTLEQRDNIKEIKSAGKHLLELVGDVLDLAKIEAGHLQLSYDRVLPSRVVDECAALLKSQIEEHELSLEISLNGLENQAILADQMRLKQIFLNLLSNAIKYNRQSGKIKIECTIVSNMLKIVIEDSGMGIPSHLQAELFQPFNRLGAERSNIEGSGVGLVITKQLVEQMGGKIGVKSQEKVGTEFWVQFPLAECAGEQEVTFDKIDTTFIDEECIPELLVQETKKILYVEDNPSNQKLMKQVLARYPVFDLTVVGLAVQGLYVARSDVPDLIILDVNLPGIDGFEIVEILKQDENTRDVPVIALSANVLSHDIQKGKAVGFDYYLTKPLNLAELITVCNQLLT
ncbi:hybrid sensor histidine kinase/response regulator [Agarilytica rhodophyticola]|uniref:hybrid sensor histidine kinase/response regulator n=1 Tax=Agarilytica rhodophyticola TaxID=1737490 RepID=UPI000B34381E|nr:PAS domain-containing hybrid sensor histidine kinase/response regulator [Agarilytica rhodophyticola]